MNSKKRSFKCSENISKKSFELISEKASMTWVLTIFFQNLEPAVEFDTVANVKQKHDINVGKCS